MAVIVMMILPVPAWLLDIGLAASFALAILIFTVTLFVERPLDFSAFPTVLLASLMLRLSLNVSSTKLIIGEGHTGTHAAGDVIQGFAMFVMGGSVLLGVVVFCVLLIVNFIVITKGAGRMAEVGARFALDGMPGKQLAIDSDMAAGAIDHQEAKARREREQAETNFFGSLDGASKFVKGDAVAGLLITLLNIVMGLVIGTTMHGMALGHAFETYAILTVGDGLVSQIPAVVISIAAALLLARGGATGATDLALLSQLGRHPAAITTVAVLMGLFAFVPGLPFLPFVLGALVLGGAAWHLNRRNTIDAAQPQDEEPAPLATRPAPSLGDARSRRHPCAVRTRSGGDGARSFDRAGRAHRQYAQPRGRGLRARAARDPPDRRRLAAAEGQYVIRVQGVIQARDRLAPGKVLALIPEDAGATPPGEDVREPVYGAPARWVAREDQEAAVLAGTTVVNPTEVLATHLLEVIRRNLARLLTLKGCGACSTSWATCPTRPGAKPTAGCSTT
jgi:flagellar biosynthesis protein FlhA